MRGLERGKQEQEKAGRGGKREVVGRGRTGMGEGQERGNGNGS